MVQTVISEYLAKVLASTKRVCVVVSARQGERLLRSDMGHVKRIQGNNGVHLLLDPSPVELASCVVKHDLRFYNRSATGQASGDELFSVVLHSANGKKVEVKVLFNFPSLPRWHWGVNCLLVLVDSDDDKGITAADSTLLNMGGVLVSHDMAEDKTYLRVKVLSTSDCSPLGLGNDDSNEAMFTETQRREEVNELKDAIRRGILEAERLKMTGLAILSPVGSKSSVSPPTLSDSDLSGTAASAVLDTVSHSDLVYVTKVVCLEFVDDESKGKTVASKILTECGGSAMIRSILCALPSLPTARIRRCVVPLPVTTASGHIVLEGEEGDSAKIFTIMGLDDCLALALKEIKQLVAE